MRLDVQVVEKKAIVTGLTKDDFIVYDEGSPQEVLYFGRESEPLLLLVLLDVSGSMKKHIDLMATKAQQALRYLRVGDRVGIMIFSRDTKVHQPFTGDLVEAARQIRTAAWDEELGSGTSINAAVIDAAVYIESYVATRGHAQHREERRAILIVTDNLGLNYQLPDRKVLSKLYGTDTVLNALVVGRGNRPLPPPPGRYTNPDFSPADVFLLADKSGGEAVKAERADATFPEMVERIRTRYSLHYRAPGARPGEFRRVRVELTPAARKRFPDAELRYRSGYEAN